MKRDVVPVQIRGIIPANNGCSVFMGNDEKVFVIQMEHNMGVVIGMFLRQTPKERPLTHDLISSIPVMPAMAGRIQIQFASRKASSRARKSICLTASHMNTRLMPISRTR